jgi:hypothetical protein
LAENGLDLLLDFLFGFLDRLGGGSLVLSVQIFKSLGLAQHIDTGNEFERR